MIKLEPFASYPPEAQIKSSFESHVILKRNNNLYISDLIHYCSTLCKMRMIKIPTVCEFIDIMRHADVDLGGRTRHLERLGIHSLSSPPEPLLLPNLTCHF